MAAMGRPSEKQMRKKIKALQAKTTSDTQVFGITLAAAVSRHRRADGLPLALAQSISFLDTNHLQSEGLYRVPGSKLEVDYFQAYFDSNTPVAFPPWLDCCTITSLILRFLREIPDSMFTAQGYDKLRKIKNVTEAERKELVRGIVDDMPAANVALLGHLCHHLRRVADNHETTLMTSATIATCIVPQQAGNLKVMVDHATDLFPNQTESPELPPPPPPEDNRRTDCVVS